MFLLKQIDFENAPSRVNVKILLFSFCLSFPVVTLCAQ
jgi:hypothetical protein